MTEKYNELANEVVQLMREKLSVLECHIASLERKVQELEDDCKNR